MREVNVKIRLPECICQLGISTVLLYRRLRYGCAFRKIPLTKGLFAIVSPEDYDRLSQYKWYADRHDNTWYANHWAQSQTDPKKKYRIRMHREVMGVVLSLSNGRVMSVPDDKLVDHINGNGLDSRRSNLRIATQIQNGWNKRKTSSPCSSIYKGVCWVKREAKWRAQGRLNGRQKFLGYFDNERAAASAYDAWAVNAFGQYAVLNLPAAKTDHSEKWSYRICYGRRTG